MKSPRSFLLLLLCLIPNAPALDLTPQQIESIRAKFKAIKEGRAEHVASRNTSAAQTFSSAAQSPRAALDLYLKCVELIDYQKEGRPDEDFDAWKDGFENRMKDEEDGFVQSLQMQLQYLALSCRAAQAEKIENVFPSLVSYVESLSQMTEVPTGGMTQSIAGSIFAKAYELEQELSANESWEPVPLNIGGIYDKVILPYLRVKDPSGLMNAWDRRIEQQKRIVLTVERAKEEELRGLNRDEQIRMRSQRQRDTRGNNGRSIMGQYDKDDFTEEVLPTLIWSKLKDQFEHVDQVAGAKGMLDFITEYREHKLGEEFLSDFESTVLAASAAPSQPEGAGVPTNN